MFPHSSLSESIMSDDTCIEDLATSIVGIYKGLVTLEVVCGVKEVVSSVADLVVGACVVEILTGRLPLKPRRLWKPGFRILPALPANPPDPPESEPENSTVSSLYVILVVVRDGGIGVKWDVVVMDSLVPYIGIVTGVYITGAFWYLLDGLAVVNKVIPS